MIQLESGQKIGTYGLILVEELPPIIHEKYKERRVEVICPICNQEFETDLRRLTRKNRPVKMCQECAVKYVEDLNKIRAAQKIDDLTGKKFGKLTAIYPLEKRVRRSVVWHCKCDCGGTKDVLQVDLKRGHTTHCDLCSDKGFGEGRDLSNQKFGKLTPLYPTDQRKHNSVIWYCLCDCGNYCYKTTDALTKGNASSCGCLVSKGEELLQRIFQQMDLNYQPQYTFEDCVNPHTGKQLKYDFYLTDYNICVEYDGIQHFKFTNKGWNTEENYLDTIFRDHIKDEYCSRNNIPLIRIPYSDYNKLDEQYIIKNVLNVQKKRRVYVTEYHSATLPQAEDGIERQELSGYRCPQEDYAANREDAEGWVRWTVREDTA